ncbi:hypothetical protein TPY_2808 [Sulfobacillus acidophilus TPY]|uniref:Branched-chain amino acid transport n=1 Tax=Sulfobacillus acidophilus (strain ATCC 700253 / DSM 10332 / NAL) TaxID=679936 RepID=G8TTY4_SULAD|nr:hypothetical protein TPY_2808 [Sulfobacillus acidophilus TPY]AEW04575.1 branched-chain amino acid transport [Sulfobacillus acidophilus DSM 10332]
MQALWWEMGGVAIGTYLFRWLPLGQPPQFLTSGFQEWLSFITPAVLGALIVTESMGTSDVGWTNPALWALLPAGAVAWYTRRLWGTLAAGLAAYLGLRALGL